MSIELSNESGVEVDADRLQRLAVFALEYLRVSPEADLAVMLVDEGVMEELHVRWMDEPGPTDVLSFPMDELRPGTDRQPTPPGVLGDIVLCPQVAETQAEAAGHGTIDELLLLTTHGILHLLGFDHADPRDEAEMFGLQQELLLSFYALERTPAVIRFPKTRIVLGIGTDPAATTPVLDTRAEPGLASPGEPEDA